MSSAYMTHNGEEPEFTNHTVSGMNPVSNGCQKSREETFASVTR
jgi:hypothetical protein